MQNAKYLRRTYGPDWVVFIWIADNEQTTYVLSGDVISDTEMIMLTTASGVRWDDNDDSTKTEANFRALHTLSKRFNEQFHDVDWLLVDGIEDSIIAIPAELLSDQRLSECYNQDHHEEVFDEVIREWLADEFPNFSCDWKKYAVDTAPVALEGRVLLVTCSVSLW